MIRLYASLPEPTPQRFQLPPEAFHHLVRVLRAKVGDALEVFDGTGRKVAATLESIESTSATVALGAETRERPRRPLVLVQGMPKADKMEFIIQKGTELGATAFFPVETRHSLIQLDAKKVPLKQARWQKVAEEAARQCGRADVPTVFAPQSLLAAADAQRDSLALLLDEAGDAPRLGTLAKTATDRRAIALFIGPEGGWHDDERRALHNKGVHSTSLGSRILRTETASLSALAVLLHLDGELG